MKHSTWLAMAKNVALESKCVSLHVGTVLVKDGHIISSGINGTPKGYINCCDKFTGRCEEHREWSQKYEVHSELSALIYCPVETKGSIAYVSHSPCFNCCKHLAAAGIKSIYFETKYHRFTKEEFQEIVDFCKLMNIGLVECKDTWTYHSIGETEVKELFTYRDGGLYWNPRPIEQMNPRNWKSWHTENVGSRFGALHGEHQTHYRRGNITGKPHLEHRLVWLYHEGVNPRFEIDHKDGDGLNNCITNLRDVEQATNAKNHPLRKDNKSDYVGIRQLPSGNWAVYINSEYQGMRKTFELAIDFRKELELEYNYSETHGRN